VIRPLPTRLLLLVALASLVLLAACSSSPRPAVEVGDSTISNEQLDRDVKLFGFLAGLSGGSCGQPIEGETPESACARFTLTNLIQEELVKAYAGERDIVTDAAVVSDAMTQLEASVGGPGELDGQLEADGLSRTDLEAFAERLLLFNAVRDSVANEQLTDEQVQTLYEENLSQFTIVEAAHILVPSEKEAKEIAAEATPKDFADLAAERSQDPGSAGNGGSLGPLTEAAFLSQLDPVFAQTALALEPGDISEPVQTQFGWHVIYLMSRDVQPLEAVREQLVSSATSQAFADWMQEHLRAAEITVNPRYGQFDIATGQVEAVRSTNTDSPFDIPSPALTPSP
jgi:parvulin-like peptidyl-prolyl isomerase